MTKKKDNILPEVEVVAKYPHEQRVIDTMNASNAEFMQRLRNNDFRAIHNADGSYSTHVLGNADNMVFPAIQDVNGVLEDYRNLPWQRTLDKAIQNKDYIEFPTEGDARYFGEHYKKYYPEFFNHFEDNQYAEGGEMEKPKHWKEMSMADKADVMAAAIKNGVTTLEGIKKAWDDYVDHPDTTHEYAKGGYKPSASIKSRIANWEGSSMKTNRSFEAEAADFNRVIPASIRAKLNQQQLDALYSYGYNVGMGNLKARVLPMLEQYAQGRAGAKDVANSMWASLDYNPKYRGLRNRRNIERGMFMGYAPSDMQGTMVEKAINMDLSHLPTMYFKGEVSNPLIEHPYYTAPKIELSQEEEKPVAIEGLDKSLDEDTGLTNFLKLQQMMNVVGMNGGNTGNSFLEAWNNFLNGNIFADGGKKASIYKTNNGKYTTASGHPVEQIGWDDNGYARYRDTVTGDLGKAYEPSEAYTKTLIDLSKIHLAEKPLEEIYPEFDLISLGGIAKGLGKSAYSYSKLKLSPYFEKAVEERTKLANSTTSLPTELSTTFKKEGVDRMLSFINNPEIYNRYKEAGLEENFNYMKSLITKRLSDKDYFPGKFVSKIEGFPKAKGTSNIFPWSDDYGVSLVKDVPYEELLNNLDHELAHWTTGNMEGNYLKNTLLAHLAGKPKLNSKEVREIMKYNDKISPTITWDEYKETLPKGLSKQELLQKKNNFLYNLDIQERRARAYAMYQEAVRRNMTTNQLVDMYTKNGIISSEAPKQLRSLGKVYKPQDMKKFLNHFLSLSVPVTIGISTTKK